MNHKDLALNTATQLALELNKPQLVDEVQNVFDKQAEEGFQADEAYEKENAIISFAMLLIMATGLGFEIFKYYDSKKQPLPPKEDYYEQILEEFDRKEIKYNFKDAETICQKTVDLIYQSTSEGQEL